MNNALQNNSKRIFNEFGVLGGAVIPNCYKLSEGNKMDDSFKALIISIVSLISIFFILIIIIAITDYCNKEAAYEAYKECTAHASTELQFYSCKEVLR